MDSEVAAKMEKKKERAAKLKDQKKAPKPALSAWMAHVKAFRASHPSLKLGEVMKMAKASYVKATSTAS